jgi:tetratricopeptide (TPR) repeat protein
MTTSSTNAIELFYSYAQNAQDDDLLSHLEKHLSMLVRSRHIIGWNKKEILAGSDIQSESVEHFDRARLILLLVSPDFLASPYCYGSEMKRAMERHQAGDARVIPILLRPVFLEGAPFMKLQMLPSNGKPITSWSNYDEAFENVVKGISRAIKDMEHTTARSQPEEKFAGFPFPAVWNIPYQRNLIFTGRERLLTQLHDTLTANKTAVLTQLFAITGLGGIGKTQTAIEYAYRYIHDYKAVLWARATTRDTLISDFVTLAELLHLAKKDVQDQNVVVAAVKGWLVKHLNWLLILDDVDDLDMIRDFLPLESTGHVLLTTRQRVVRGIASRIEVEKMDKEEGALLLLRRSHLLEVDEQLDHATVNEQLDRATEEDRAKAEAIVTEVGGLPLALNQAGAYIEETGCDLSKYLNLYRTRFREIIGRQNDPSSHYQETVATTWSLSFQRVEQKNRAAAALLRLCAFLAPYEIPEEIITEGAAHLGNVLRPVAADPLKLNEAMEVVQKYSLVRRNPKTKTFTVHRLVQAVFKDRMNAKTRRLWAMRAIQAVNAAFPEVTYETWPDCQRYLLHAQACVNLVEQYRLASPEAARLLTQAGWYLRERGLYAQAEPLLKSALTIREQVLGLQHPDTAFTLHDLGHLYYFMGEFKKAGPFYQRALTIREQVLEPDHLNTATTLHHLGMLYHSQGKYVKAEELYKRALTIREEKLGPEHHHTTITLNHMGILYQDQGKYKKAELLHKSALTIREQTLGSQHPDIAFTLNDLARLYHSQGHYLQAEKLYKRALTIKEQKIGLQHPGTATTVSNLAHLYQDQGLYDQAETLYQRALAIRTQMLSPEHPHTVTTLNDLSYLYRLQGRYNLAQLHYPFVLKVREQVLGTDHPSTATTLNDLARLYQDQGLYDQAEPLYRRALAIRTRILSPEHPHTAITLGNLASLYQAQGRYTQAESPYQRALAIIEQVLGTDHPSVTTTLNDLATLYQAQGRYDQAEPLYRRALAIKEEVLGLDHPSTATTLNDLASLYQAQGRYDQAEPLYQRALRIRENTLGSDHPSTATTLNDLASLNHVQRKYSQAELFYRRALQIREKVLGLDHPRTALSLGNLASLYYAEEKYEQAALFYERALAIYKRVLGPDHPVTVATSESYADFVRKTKRDEEAT